MRRFASLYCDLDRTSGSKARVQALHDYFSSTAPADAAWALHVLLGRQGRRLISGRRLRQICLEGSSLPPWLFDDCYAHVGDTAETIALLWRQLAPAAAPLPSPAPDDTAGQPLHHWMEALLPAAAALDGDAQAAAVRRLWHGLSTSELLVTNKLLTGGLRVGVGQGLVLRALAQLSGLELPLLQHRLMGGFTPSAAAFAALLARSEASEAAPSRPYPFFLASPLDPGSSNPEHSSPLPGPCSAWLVEWKFDGIRAQLIRRAGESFLWSRGEELLNHAFPELLQAAALLPDGCVLDGELLVWPAAADHPASFSQLQRRLGRKAPPRSLLLDCPAVFVAYDLLELDGSDGRQLPLSQRRALLEALLQRLAQAAAAAAGRLRLSPRLPLERWSQLESWRQQAAAAGAEGLMLKQLASPYLAGRRRGHWWKHKRDPYRLDAVLLYAQAGSGRRANLFTDYTFGLWEHPPSADDAQATPADGAPPEPRLVSFAKAYSGLADAEIVELDRWIRRHTTERFGPVRAVEPLQVFELAFEGIQPSGRHRSGLAVRFPRISRWRRDKPAAEADCLAAAQALLAPGPAGAATTETPA